MASNFTDRVIATVLQIPPGKVATYGMVAMLAGSPRAARQVGWLLHSLSEKRQLPWHRVVNRQGAVSLRDAHDSRWQRFLLEGEGVVFGADGRIDLSRYLWRPQGAGGECITSPFPEAVAKKKVTGKGSRL